MENVIETILDRIKIGLLKELDRQIIERLDQRGHKFETEQELHEFAKSDRCRIMKTQIANGSFDCWFFVDGKEIAFWNDDVNIVWDNNKVTATMND